MEDDIDVIHVQVAFDTTVELKRSLRGLRGREENLEVSSKIDVVDTMLQHLMKKIGVPSLPPPPETSNLSSLQDAMRLSRALRLMLSKLPPGFDANSMHQVKYNLVVYDLEQVSRQLDEIMFKLSENPAYMELKEPAVSQYDEVLGSVMEGVKRAFAVMGDDKRQKQWDSFTDQTEAEFQPRWLQRLKKYAKEHKGEGRVSQRRDNSNMNKLNDDYKDIMYPKICATARNHEPSDDMGILCGQKRTQTARKEAAKEGGGEVKSEEGAPKEEEEDNEEEEPEEEEEKEEETPAAKKEELMDDVIDAAIRQTAAETEGKCCHAQAAHVAEATAVVSAMRQLISSERSSLEDQQRSGAQLSSLSSSPAGSEQHTAELSSGGDDVIRGGGLSDPVGTESLLQRPAMGWRKMAAKARLQLLAEKTGGKARLQSLDEEVPDYSTARLGMTRYDEMIERDAVYQASKTAMELELKDPKQDEALEDAVSVAVQAAIHAEQNDAYAPVLQDAERAAIEGATKAAKQEEADAQGSKGKDSARKLVIAQRVEHAAIQAAIQAARPGFTRHVVAAPPQQVAHILMPQAPAGYRIVGPSQPMAFGVPQLPMRVQTSYAYSTAPQQFSFTTAPTQRYTTISAAAPQPRYTYVPSTAPNLYVTPSGPVYTTAQPGMVVHQEEEQQPKEEQEEQEEQEQPVVAEGDATKLPVLPALAMPAGGHDINNAHFAIGGANGGQLNVNSGTFVPDAVQSGAGTVSGTIFVKDGSVDP